MDKVNIKNLIKSLESSLTEKSMRVRLDMGKKEILTLMKNTNWKKCVTAILSEDKFDSVSILKGLKPVIDSLCSEPEEGWLSFIFNEITAEMFPVNFESKADEEQKRAMYFFLENYRYILKFEQVKRRFSTVDDFLFCSDDEYKECVTAAEYSRFLDFWYDSYIYEFMRLAREVTPFNTIGHISGVHHVAMFMGRQLHSGGVNVDLGLVSGSAAMHDLGKFGCTKEEAPRIPHLHYYYTNILCSKVNLPMIGHIASNHSTWDLELENLSIESLLLIYADFRVRSHREDGVEKVNFYTLDDAFHIILSKLENVDDAKKKRYIKVYMKLKDFENYMVSLGLETDVLSSPADNVGMKGKDDALLMGMEVVEKLKHKAIEHNIRMMAIFNNEAAFGSLLENARTETDVTNLRTYLDILEEYSTYMTKQEKLMTLRFMYDNMSNKEGDIRRQAASILGKIIANYNEPYRKELPAHAAQEKDDSIEVWNYYLRKIVFPGHRVTEQHRRWVRYTLKLAIIAIINSTPEDKVHLYTDEFFKLYNEDELSDNVVFVLLESLLAFPREIVTEDILDTVIALMERESYRESVEVRASILRACEYISLQENRTEEHEDRIVDILKSIESITSNVSADYIFRKTKRNLNNESTADKTIMHLISRKKSDITSDLLREDLKVGTPWVIKTINIEFLSDYAMYSEDESTGFYLASHFSNLLKVSEKVTVRTMAGKCLVKVAEKLPLVQTNEIVVELENGLEIGDYQYSKYIPPYLGQLALYLHPSEFNEFLSEIGLMLQQDDEIICSVALYTLGEVVEHYSSYKFKDMETEDEYLERLHVILGMLLKGMSNYNNEISQEAFTTISQYIFKRDILSLEEKFSYFKYIYKKMLTLIRTSEDDINSFTNAASLNNIYRFISEYIFTNKEMTFPVKKNIAFFPGTFDPFSLGHLGIVQKIKEQGFETYLALDEFSWSKHTQPRMMRRKIMTMSVASEPDVFLFSDDFPVNIANPQDIRRLKNLFPDNEVYMVAGSDVLINASSYKAEPTEDSIHSVNHIVFRRDKIETGSDVEALHKAYENMTGEIVELQLPTYLEDISSTMIRDNIDNGRDISRIIDPVAQNYIYENSLYLREPMYKSVLEIKDITIENLDSCSSSVIDSMKIEYLEINNPVLEKIKEYLDEGGVDITVINDRDGDVSAFAAYHEIATAELYDEFMDLDMAAYLRKKAVGRILVIRCLYIDRTADMRNILKILTTEVLARACEKGVGYAVYHPIEEKISNVVFDVLSRQGFYQTVIDGAEQTLMEVDMRNPIAVIENMDTVLKSPFNDNSRILDVLEETHAELQSAIAALAPGNLVLSFNAGVMNHKIINMVTAANEVPNVPLVPRQLGKLMCVPFGKILSGMVVPNTVTKTLHTEKKFSKLLDSFIITEYPEYATIPNQIKTIKSFGRKVVLVDDILHKGYRISFLDNMFKDSGVEIDRMIVGVLSGRGKDLMKLQGREVESAYFIPNMKYWFTESTIYPFIGGDSLETKEKTEANLIHSINLILPFAAPPFLGDCDNDDVYNFSLVSLENTVKIFKVIEEEYQSMFERQLTVRRLSDVVKQPRMPNGLNRFSGDLNMSPSAVIGEYIERLKRIRKAVI